MGGTVQAPLGKSQKVGTVYINIPWDGYDILNQSNRHLVLPSYFKKNSHFTSVLYEVFVK